jgi:hypothetical protein
MPASPKPLANVVNGLKAIVHKRANRLAMRFSAQGELARIGRACGTDKFEHGYLDFYERHFSPLRETARVVLEIGIGGYDDPNAGGASLRMWEQYFPNAAIHGLDIHDKSPHSKGRVRSHRGGQDDAARLKALIAEIGRPDIVIDDGSHVSPHVIASFATLFPLVNNGGVYAVEDLQTSYLPAYGGSFEGGLSSVEFLKDLADSVNFKSIPRRSPQPWDGLATEVHFYPKLAFIHRGRNDYPHALYEQDLVKKASEAAR